MKLKLLIITGFIFVSYVGASQENNKISTLETVEVINNNKAEALYYFQNNWAKLREQAIENKLIYSYQLLEVDYTESTPFHFILITTYLNASQFENREAVFQKLIESNPGLKLLNHKKPNEFRKSVFSITKANNLN
ncbi:MAG: hypothetical protein AAF688_00140 [Bacteroidota bacterium]